MPIDKKAMEKFMALDGKYVRRNLHAEAIETHSPALNFIFGNGWGLPKGFSMLLFGRPKGGKSLISRSMIGKLHQNDSDAVALVFDTEMRWEAQCLSDVQQLKAYNIDENRLKVIPTNHPAKIFDRIEKEIPAFIEAGVPIKLIIIDSITGVMGRRAGDQETIMTMQRGDHAATLQDGLKQILGVLRKYNIGLILTTQIRDEQNAQELMKKKTIKAAAAWATKHFAEYAMYVEEIDSQAGRKTLSGEALQDLSLQVFQAKKTEGEQIGHRIRARMVGASMGPKNRKAEFTVIYKEGFVNQHEETFVLGVGSGAIDKPSPRSYVFGDRKWGSSGDVMEALKTEPELCSAILQEVKKRDLAGTFKGVSEIEEESPDTEESSDEED